MPSVRTCLASLAVLAIAFNPVVSAKGTRHDSSLIARHDTSHSARSVSSAAAAELEKRSSRKLAAAKRIARRKAAAAKIPAARAPTNGKPTSRAPITNSGSTSTTNSGSSSTISSYTPGSAFMSSALIAAAAAFKCGSDNNCAYVTGGDPSKVPYCNTVTNVNVKAGHCTYRCAQGFAPDNFGNCIASPDACGSGVCPPVAGGYVYCTDAGTCGQMCNGNDRMFHNANFSAYICYRYNDPNHCGPNNEQCPQDYAQLGVPKCTGTSCTLACPGGTQPVSDSSSAEPLMCPN